MDKAMFDGAIEYEKLTQSIYQLILHKEGLQNIEVLHNQDVKGRSGVEHQIDVMWTYRQAGVIHKVLVECKNYASSISLEKARNFFAVLHDIDAKGIIVTKTGYQSGVVTYCKYYDIALKMLRAPTDDDWEGRLRNIKFKIALKIPVSTEEKPVILDYVIEARDDAEKELLTKLETEGKINVSSVADSVLFDKNGFPATEPIGQWLPKQLDVLSREQGGPYVEVHELNDLYTKLNPGTLDERLVKVSAIRVEYFVEVTESSEYTIYGDQVISAVLRDYNSGEVEYMHHGDKREGPVNPHQPDEK